MFQNFNKVPERDCGRGSSAGSHHWPEGCSRLQAHSGEKRNEKEHCSVDKMKRKLITK